MKNICHLSANVCPHLKKSTEKLRLRIKTSLVSTEQDGVYEGGKSVRELAAEYEKPFKTIKNMLTRENNKKRKQATGIFSNKQRGRKPAITLQEYKYENKRLRMENELLQDFLCEIGRK